MPGTYHLEALVMGGRIRGYRSLDSPGIEVRHQRGMRPHMPAVGIGIAASRPECTRGGGGEERQRQAIEVQRPEEDETQSGQSRR